MIRKLKVMGLALVAVFAMSAVVASAASAATTDGEFTSDGSVTVTGTGAAETFTFEPGQKDVCHGDHTIMPQNQTPWGFFNPGTGLTTLTDLPYYTKCTTTVGATSLPATYTVTGGCDFLWHMGETTGGVGGTYGATLDIVCIPGESLETHVYQNATHATSVCTYRIPAQNGLTGAHVTNLAGGTIKVSGEITGVTMTRTGVVCGGTKETNAGIMHVDFTVSGTNAEGKPTAISITD
jgi:hypothetical protein